MLTSELNPDVGDSREGHAAKVRLNTREMMTSWKQRHTVSLRIHNRQDETWGATRIKRTPFLYSIAREIE